MDTPGVAAVVRPAAMHAVVAAVVAGGAFPVVVVAAVGLGAVHPVRTLSG